MENRQFGERQEENDHNSDFSSQNNVVLGKRPKPEGDEESDQFD
jgi:hypothetical protein